MGVGFGEGARVVVSEVFVVVIVGVAGDGRTESILLSLGLRRVSRSMLTMAWREVLPMWMTAVGSDTGARYKRPWRVKSHRLWLIELSRRG